METHEDIKGLIEEAQTRDRNKFVPHTGEPYKVIIKNIK